MSPSDTRERMTRTEHGRAPEVLQQAPPGMVLVPAFNEAEAIAGVVADIRRHTDYPVLVIDDCSQDDTVAAAESAGARVLPLASQLGAWGATQAGIRYALRQRCELLITMDADGQHLAAYLDELLAPVRAGTADVSIGAFTERGSRARRIAWWLMKRSSGISLEDVTSGFRVYNRRAAVTLADWRATLCSYQDIGVLTLLLRNGLRITDVPVAMRERRHGHSRVFHSWLTVIYYMMHTLLLGFTKRSLRRHTA